MWYRYVEFYTVDTLVKNSIKFRSVTSGEDKGKEALHFLFEFPVCTLGKGTFKEGDHISSGNICANERYLSARKILKHLHYFLIIF